MTPRMASAVRAPSPVAVPARQETEERAAMSAFIGPGGTQSESPRTSPKPTSPISDIADPHSMWAYGTTVRRGSLTAKEERHPGSGDDPDHFKPRRGGGDPATPPGYGPGWEVSASNPLGASQRTVPQGYRLFFFRPLEAFRFPLAAFFGMEHPMRPSVIHLSVRTSRAPLSDRATGSLGVLGRSFARTRARAARKSSELSSQTSLRSRSLSSV